MPKCATEFGSLPRIAPPALEAVFRLAVTSFAAGLAKVPGVPVLAQIALQKLGKKMQKTGAVSSPCLLYVLII